MQKIEYRDDLAASESFAALDRSDEIDALPLPSSEDLKILRSFDPRRFFLGNKGEERRDPFAK